MLAVIAVIAGSNRALAGAACPGDCNGDGRVSIGELITVINMNLGLAPVSACPAGAREPGMADNHDVVCALRNSLYSTCQSC
jgi:hypothetical protein